MVDTTTSAPRKVVNLAEYRAARDARESAGTDTHTDTSLAPPAAPARVLLPHEVEHRARMLSHLATS